MANTEENILVPDTVVIKGELPQLLKLPKEVQEVLERTGNPYENQLHQKRRYALQRIARAVAYAIFIVCGGLSAAGGVKALQNFRQSQAFERLENIYGEEEQARIQKTIVEMLQKAFLRMEGTQKPSTVSLSQEETLFHIHAHTFADSIDFESPASIQPENIYSFILNSKVTLAYPEAGTLLLILNVAEDVDDICNPQAGEGFDCVIRFSRVVPERKVNMKHIVITAYFDQEGRITSGSYQPVLSANNTGKMDIIFFHHDKIPPQPLSLSQKDHSAKILGLVDLIHKKSSSAK